MFLLRKCIGLIISFQYSQLRLFTFCTSEFYKKMAPCTVPYLSSSEKPVGVELWTEYLANEAAISSRFWTQQIACLPGSTTTSWCQICNLVFPQLESKDSFIAFSHQLVWRARLKEKRTVLLTWNFCLYQPLLSRQLDTLVNKSLQLFIQSIQIWPTIWFFKPCIVIDSRIPSYNLEKNIKKLKSVAKEIFCNLEIANQFNLNFYMLNLVAEK